MKKLHGFPWRFPNHISSFTDPNPAGPQQNLPADPTPDSEVDPPQSLAPASVTAITGPDPAPDPTLSPLQQDVFKLVQQIGSPLVRQVTPLIAQRIGPAVATKVGPPLMRRVAIPLVKRVGAPILKRFGLFLIKKLP